MCQKEEVLPLSLSLSLTHSLTLSYQGSVYLERTGIALFKNSRMLLRKVLPVLNRQNFLANLIMSRDGDMTLFADFQFVSQADTLILNSSDGPNKQTNKQQKRKRWHFVLCPLGLWILQFPDFDLGAG